MRTIQGLGEKKMNSPFTIFILYLFFPVLLSYNNFLYIYLCSSSYSISLHLQLSESREKALQLSVESPSEDVSTELQATSANFT